MNPKYYSTQKPSGKSLLRHIKNGMRRYQGRSLGFLCLLVFVAVSSLHAQTFPDPPVLVSPPKGAVIQFPGPGKDTFFSWNPVTGATQYIINVILNRIPVVSLRTANTSIYIDLHLKETDSQATVSWSVLSVSGTIDSKTPATSQFTFNLEGTPQPTQIPSMTPTPLPPPVLYQPEDKEEISALGQFLVLFDWSDVTGASGYRLTVYKDNEELLNRVIAGSKQVEQFQQQIFAVLQWDVRTIDALGNIGYPGLRHAFSIGKDSLPTPTPMPIDLDIDRNQKIDVLDVYQFAARFATNDPKVDLNYSGLNNAADLLMFLELYRTR